MSALRLDHIAYAVPELGAGIEDLEQRLGVRASPGGKHVGLGTHNALLSLGDDQYLEVIAPDPDQPRPDRALPFGLDELDGSRLVTWAAKESDLEARVAASKRAGYDPGIVLDLFRDTPQGERIEWRLTMSQTPGGDGLVPFLIDWGGNRASRDKLRQGLQARRRTRRASGPRAGPRVARGDRLGSRGDAGAAACPHHDAGHAPGARGAAMKAVFFEKHGAADVLQYGDFPDPEVGHGEVLVEVRACSLNYLDIFSRRGMPGIKIELPSITGADCAGHIAQLGDGVLGWETGQRVMLDPVYRNLDTSEFRMMGENCRGALAEYCVVDQSQLIAIPEDVSDDAAACLPVSLRHVPPHDDHARRSAARADGAHPRRERRRRHQLAVDREDARRTRDRGRRH